MVNVNNIEIQQDDKTVSTKDDGVRAAAGDAWKPGQSDGSIKWGSHQSNEPGTDMHVPNIWSKFDSLTNSSTESLYQKLSARELLAAETELTRARQALQQGDTSGALADMQDAQQWFGVSDKDFARGGSADGPGLGDYSSAGDTAGGDGGSGFGQDNTALGGSDGSMERGAQKPPETMPPTGNYTAKDGKIFDPDGKEFVPVGVNITPYDNPVANIDKVTKDWNMNFIRLNCWDWSKSKPQSPDEIEQIVDQYTKRGIVVDVELHGPSGHIMQGQELTDAADWYRELATRYKGNPNVWFGTPNEAGTNDTSQYGQWANEEKTILGAIRGTGAMNMVMVNDSDWGQGATQGGPSALEQYGSQLESYGNVIAEQHEYSNNSNAYQQLVDSQNKLVQDGWGAVVLGEVGTSNGWPNPFATTNGMRAAMKNAQVNRRGVVAWGYQYGDTGEPGGNNSLTRDGNLNGERTEMGDDLWNLAHSGL